MKEKGPRCRHLRAKKMYSRPPTEAEFTTSACWCLKTMTAIGPDGDRVGEGDCARGRPCYEEEKR